ncbi:VWA domain-containing protein [Paracoccus sp. Z118]|uniref:VWA domain-containing protein n=1 Tax=Paracoccus sp. Z118 TaxID=2851017 RepID=UPI001C2BB3C5|nr:VWA domain-containing protein [Paracoccus sp. Z118]MBV0892113.1 VWA domain-containing protein [Paracoccus sp. Z118]
MTAFVLLRPLWLLALLPLAALFLWLRRRGAAGGWEALVEPSMLKALRGLGLLVEGGGRRMALLPWLAAGALAVALSGPAVLRPGATEFRALDPLILMLDLSPSVVADESVLNELRSRAAELLAGAEGRPVGVLLYAGDAYLASAPTSDAASLQGLVAVLDRGIVPVAGSRPDVALSMSRDLFAAPDVQGLGGADLVVLSDGGGITPRAIEEAARMKTDGARVWTLALPRAAEGAPPADGAALEQLAAAGGGAAFASAAVPDLMARIARARTARLAEESTAGQAFRDFGPPILLLALLALWPLFRRQR